jgi:hypothetical protein
MKLNTKILALLVLALVLEIGGKTEDEPTDPS